MYDVRYGALPADRGANVLGRLAVDRNHQGRSIGKHLLI
jgi:hypothetical protein